VEFEGLQKKETALRVFHLLGELFDLIVDVASVLKETNKLLLKSLAEAKEAAAKTTRDSLLKEEELAAKLKSLVRLFDLI